MQVTLVEQVTEAGKGRRALREVQRVFTPGTLFEEELLPARGASELVLGLGLGVGLGLWL